MLLEARIRRITVKELTLFFASPVAYLFLAAFATITLFIFFWGEAFFSRNIADVRPLFEWMPILLIFLTSALTMRMWSEERRSGTLEHVLTQPFGVWRFVLGKFTACLILLAIALAVTLALPITVSLLGDLDWGPVFSGYLAALLLGAVYLSAGLFVSARSDNQIVSLISSVTLCGLLYLAGAPALTHFFSNQAGEWMRLIGTGARFNAITRGVIDIRDFAYYLSLTSIFLVLNTDALERERWAAAGDKARHRAWRIATALLIANALGVNLWLGQINTLRIDTTEGGMYSISEATHGYLAQLQEPLLIRGYFSAKTHPLLAPLVPQMRDLIREYEASADGRVRAEFIDPMNAPELEEEANQKYGIRPVPFQVADRYQASLVNSYFDVLVQYGDAFQTLGFRDLIEIKTGRETDLDVRLRNPEYDLTRAVKKVLQDYQGGGNLFDTVKGDLQFTAYVSEDKRLPKALADFKDVMNQVLEDVQKDAKGRFKTRIVDPAADDGKVARQIEADYGFQPMMASLFDANTFFYYMTLSKDDQVTQIPLGDLSEGEFRRNLEGSIKRFSSGFTKTIALAAPENNPQMARFGMAGVQFSQLRKVLEADFNVQTADLKTGRLPGETDLLFLAAPDQLDEKQLFAVDQFLMRGGTVLVAAAPFNAEMSMQRLSLAERKTGLEDWLAHHGLTIEKQVVMDPQNAAFPVPVTRQAGGFSFQEIRMLDYPYFIDIRGEGLNPESPITRGLNQLTLAWSSPIEVDAEKNKARAVTELLHSSEGAWLSDSLDIMPQVTRTGTAAFVPTDDRGRRLLGVVSEGRFDSYFAGKDSPLLAKDEAEKTDQNEESEKADDPGVISGVIERSPESARLIVLSSNDFLSDQVLQLSGAVSGSAALGALQLAANAVEWAVEDQGLLSIRSRGHFNRTLPPMVQSARRFWEYVNYALALAAIILLAFIQGVRRRKRMKRYLAAFAAEGGAK